MSTQHERSHAQAALAPAWICVCYRCGHTWVEACGCVAFVEGVAPDARPIHQADCRPSAHCPKCGTAKWWEGH